LDLGVTALPGDTKRSCTKRLGSAASTKPYHIGQRPRLVLETASLNRLGDGQHESMRVISNKGAALATTKVKAKRDNRGPSMDILVVDVGGTHVKILATGQNDKREFASRPTLTAPQMAEGVRELAAGWNYDVVSVGYPGPVLHNRPVADPNNLGPGWMGFDFNAAFKRPVKVMNDAAMQALGSYKKGKMLFLGLGTGLGSAVIMGGIVEPMELGHLPYKKATYEDYVGERGLERLGKRRWRKHVFDVVGRLVAALEPDDVVLGGGNAKMLKELPPRCRMGDNANAFTGGFLMWKDASKSRKYPSAGFDPID
jgi:polyphosphate glucokinase